MLALLNTLLIVVSGAALIAGRVFIAKKNIKAHKRAMLTATAFAALFLVVYVARWASGGSTPFTGQGPIRTFYFALLIVHSILAVAVGPMALVAIRRGMADQRAAHKKIARLTFPIWLFVAVSGWAIYWMLYHL